jgi:predicted nuclease of predicted toxin-antitoxin system
MKLLLDENLSRRLVPFLQDAFPGSSQVVLEGLERANDQAIWEFAKANDFVIVTKDSDFYELSLLYGAPPRIVWLQFGNSSRSRVIQLLLDNATEIKRRLQDDETKCLVLG